MAQRQERQIVQSQLNLDDFIAANHITSATLCTQEVAGSIPAGSIRGPTGPTARFYPVT